MFVPQFFSWSLEVHCTHSRRCVCDLYAPGISIDCHPTLGLRDPLKCFLLLALLTEKRILIYGHYLNEIPI